MPRLLSAGCFLVAACLASTLVAREWKDSTGSFSVEAELVQVVDGQAELRKTDGKVIRVPLAKLSQADRAFLQSVAKKAPSKEPGPAAKPAATDSIEELLAKPLSLKLVDVRLADLNGALKRQTNLNAVLDSEALAADKKDASQRLNFTSTGKPLADELDRLLMPLGLTWLAKDHVVLITTPDGAAAHASVRVYKLARPGAVTAAAIPAIAPRTWSSQGGAGEALIVGDVVLIRQSGPQHRAIETKLGAKLQRVVAPAPEKTGLYRPVTLAYMEMPLADVARYMQKGYKLQLRFDEPALADAGLATNMPITLIVAGVPLASGLNLLLEPHGLTWMPDKDGILITTPEGAEAKLLEQRYDVADLMPGGNPDTLITTITTMIDPSSWNELGGPASIDTAAPGTLQIKQTWANHEALARLLAEIRLAAK